MDLNFKVEVDCPDTEARTGRMQTLTESGNAPIFMPVGTRSRTYGR